MPHLPECATATGLPLAERATSLAFRMLSGASTPTLIGYRLPGQPVLETFAHGLGPDGGLLVAMIATDDPIFTAPAPLPVRMELTKYSPQLDIRIVAASLHFLGELNWLDAATVDQLELPDVLASIAASPNARIGIVHTEGYLLRDGTGVTSLTSDEVLAWQHEPAAAGIAELEDFGFQLAAELPEVDRAIVFSGISEEWISGVILSRMTGISGCHHIDSRVFIVDIDVTGVTLMRVSEEVSTVVFAPFRHTAHCSTELEAELDRLMTLHHTGANAFIHAATRGGTENSAPPRATELD